VFFLPDDDDDTPNDTPNDNDDSAFLLVVICDSTSVFSASTHFLPCSVHSTFSFVVDFCSFVFFSL
jgi:hypothetical protein